MNPAPESIDPLMLRPSIMDVDLDALEHNFQVIRKHVRPSKVMAVVKANAYGHGAVLVAHCLEKSGAEYFGVALVEEGIALRQAGIKVPILVFGGIFGGQIELFLEYDLDISVSSVDKLRAVEEVSSRNEKRARVHLVVDTGMGRIGVRPESFEPLLQEVEKSKHCDVVGVFSHFATASEGDRSYVETQLIAFEKAVRLAKERLGESLISHMANSAATLLGAKFHFDMVRPGLLHYGICPLEQKSLKSELKPVMSLSSKVVFFKVVKKGQGISYGHTWKADRDTRIVTIPLGYGDGYFPNLGNRGQVLINGKRYPIVGSVCMDQMMVDIGWDTAYNGDSVVLLGRQGDEEITVREIAELSGSHVHAVLASTNLRIPRRYKWRGQETLA